MDLSPPKPLYPLNFMKSLDPFPRFRLYIFKNYSFKCIRLDKEEKKEKRKIFFLGITKSHNVLQRLHLNFDT